MIKAFLHWFRHDWAIWFQVEAHQERRCSYCNFVERFQMPCFHQWGQWEMDGEIVAYDRRGTEKRQIGFTQTRTCKVCGFTELDIQTIQFLIEHDLPNVPKAAMFGAVLPVVVWVFWPARESKNFPCKTCSEVYGIDLSRKATSATGETFWVISPSGHGSPAVCACMGSLIE